MKKIIIMIAVIGLFASQVFAKGTDEEKDSGDTLRVAMELQYPPFEMQDINGNPDGVSPTIAKALGEYLGRPVEIQNTAWTGLIPALQTGKADLVISSMTITEERKKVIDFSDPYAQSGLGLLIYKDSPVQSIDDFLNPLNVITDATQVIKIGVRSGTIAAVYAEKHKLDDHPNVEVINQDTPSAQLLEVTQGRVDAVMYDPLTLFKNHKEHPDTTRVNLAPVETPGPWGIAIKKGNKELLTQVNSFLQAYRAAGGFEELGNTYLSDMKELFESNDVPFFFDVE